MEPYKVETTQRGPIDNLSIGHYTEQLISNYTPSTIMIVDKDNTRHTIDPVTYHSSEGHVEITLRKTSKQRNASGTSEDIPIPTTQISIHYGDLIIKPIYVAEADVIVCLPAFSSSVVHPRFAASYEDAISRIHLELKDSLKQPSLYILANDPSKVVDRIFISIEGIVREVLVTAYPGELRCCTLLFPGKVSGYNKIQIPMSDIESGKGSVRHKGHTFYIGLSKNNIEKKRLEDINAINEMYTEEDIKEKIKINNNKHDECIKQWKEKYDNLNSKYSLDKDAFDTKVSSLNAQLTELRGILSSREDLDKLRTAELTTRKAEIGVKGEEYKLYGTVAKIGLPIALSLITWLLLDKKKG